MLNKPAEKEKASFDSFLEYLYLRIYEFFYITGIRFIRQIRGGYHFVTGQIRYIKSGVKEWLIKSIRHFYNSFRNIVLGKYHAFMSYSNRAADAFEVLQNSRSESKEQRFSAFKNLLWCWGILVWKIFCTIFNYLAPVCAAIILVVTFQYFSVLEYGLSLKSDGKTLAYITGEDVYNKAEQIIRSRTSEETTDIGNIAPQFSIVPVSSLELTEAEDLANIILKNSGQRVFTKVTVFTSTMNLSVRQMNPIIFLPFSMNTANSTAKKAIPNPNFSSNKRLRLLTAFFLLNR